MLTAESRLALYGVSTRVLNQAVKRNRVRFPRFSPSLPYAFTERGASMLASLLNIPIAVETSGEVVRAFVRLREILATHKDIVVFDAIRQLMAPPAPARSARVTRKEEFGRKWLSWQRVPRGGWPWRVGGK